MQRVAEMCESGIRAACLFVPHIVDAAPLLFCTLLLVTTCHSKITHCATSAYGQDGKHSSHIAETVDQIDAHFFSGTMR